MSIVFFFFKIYFEVFRKILLKKREETLNEVVVLRFLRLDVYQKWFCFNIMYFKRVDSAKSNIYFEL